MDVVVVGGEEGDVAVADHVCYAHVHITWTQLNASRVGRDSLFTVFVSHLLLGHSLHVPGVQNHNMRT